MKLRLKERYAITIFALIVLLVLVNSGVYTSILKQYSNRVASTMISKNSDVTRAQFEMRGDAIAIYLAETMFDPLYYLNLQAMGDLISPAQQSQDVAQIYVFDREGNIVHDGTESLEQFGDTLPGLDVVASVVNQGQAFAQFNQDSYVSIRPIKAGFDVIGGVYVELSTASIASTNASIESIISGLSDDIRSETVSHLVLVNSAILIISILASIVVANTITGPLRRLKDYAQEIGQGEFTSIGLKREDEIGDLASELEDMGQKLSERNKEISYLAYHDSLTQLPNRFSFIDFVSSRIAQQEDNFFSLLFIDLDGFKTVNDRLGHESGDQLLTIISERIVKLVRDEPLSLSSLAEEPVGRDGDCVARLGGDEFLVYLEGVGDPDRIFNISRRLIESIKQPVDAGDIVTVGASIGAAIYPVSGDNALTLIKHADIAMYEAKKSGKNTAKVFSPEILAQINQKADYERTLRASIDDPKQFELWFQPQFNLETQELIGAEALVRWRHKERGLIQPDLFIPIAESTGMIGKLGEYIIDQAFEQLTTWEPVLPEGFHLAINLSPKQLYESNLDKRFAHYLSKTGCNARLIHVEITESALLKNEKEAAIILESLSDMGIEIWLDDFGTGFSSLSYIRQFPVDGLKIDRSFINDIEWDPQDRSLTEAIISMAHKLNLKVVAEGVETREQESILKAAECDINQGYFYGKPIPAEEFEARFLRLSSNVFQLPDRSRGS